MASLSEGVNVSSISGVRHMVNKDNGGHYCSNLKGTHTGNFVGYQGHGQNGAAHYYRVPEGTGREYYSSITITL
jgi:hypothetical protein